VVYVGTIAINHFELCKMMLEHDKHVLCEKPMCLLVEHTEELVELARARKKFLLEGIWSRFFPVYRHLRRELRKRSIGDVQMITVQ
jgi:dihydrodiol dehydrogenase / D-xylose 1-dehydrogenase (NADP)